MMHRNRGVCVVDTEAGRCLDVKKLLRRRDDGIADLTDVNVHIWPCVASTACER